MAQENRSRLLGRRVIIGGVNDACDTTVSLITHLLRMGNSCGIGYIIAFDGKS